MANKNKDPKSTLTEKFYNNVGYNKWRKQQAAKGNFDVMSKKEYRKKKSTQDAVSDAKGTTNKKKNNNKDSGWF